MNYRRPCQSVPLASILLITSPSTKRIAAVVLILFAAVASRAQDQPQNSEPTYQNTPTQSNITIPAGTRLTLVLTHPVQSRYIHHGDDIYAQITSPVDSGDQMVIPPGTFVQGKVDRLERHGQRGILHLQSMVITFPNGYVAPFSGQTTLETGDGYAIGDPGSSRALGAVMAPVAGAGIGALIGHSIPPSSSTLTTTLPDGCVGPPPGCLTSSLTVPGNRGKGTVIGSAIGGAIGTVTSITLLIKSRHFFVDVGSPVEMTLQQPVLLKGDAVSDAVQRSVQHPMPEPAIAPRPLPPAPDTPVDHGTCYAPETPGTPPTVIPGAPGPDGIPGPPTTIPGSPPIPGTPYPCP